MDFKYSKKWTAVAFVTAQFISLQALAGEVSVNYGVDVDWVEQNIKLDDGTSIDSSNQIIKPFTTISYAGRDINGTLQSSHNHIRRQLSGEDVTQNYTNFQYAANYEAVRGLLNIGVSGSQDFRGELVNSFLVDDFLLNGDNLNKVTTQEANVSLTLPRGKYFGLDATAAFRDNKSTRNDSNTSSVASLFDSTSYAANISAISGKRIIGVRSTLTASVNYVERSTFQNFISQTANLNNRINLYKQLGLAINGSYENNDIRTNSDMPIDNFREFYSLGAGLVWQSSANRSVEIVWNRSFRELPTDTDTEEDSFLSYNVNWAFSGRTSLNGTFTKRFFGDAGNLSFVHQLRNWRSSITYNESVNTTSQLASSNSLALFVCQNGSTNLADCQLSASLTPDLGVGETLQPFLISSLDLNDRVIISKTLSAQTAITRRRTTLSLTASKSEIDEIEIERLLDTTNISVQLSFNISAKSTLNIASTLVFLDSETPGELQTQITREQSISLSRDLTRNLSTALSFRNLERQGDDNVFGGGNSFTGISGPFTDNRITFGVSYSFGG